LATPVDVFRPIRPAGRAAKMDAVTLASNLTDRIPPVPPAQPFHRLNRTASGYRWWKPLLVGLIGAALYLLALLLVIVALIVGGLVSPALQSAVDGFFSDPTTPDLNDPFTFTLTMGSIILMLPALLIATLLLGTRPIGLLSSVAGRIRWRWLGLCLGLALAIYLVGYLVYFALTALRGEPVVVSVGNPGIPLLFVLIVLLVPLQAAAEEYVFRGYLMQTIGGWLRHPAFAILLPVPLFVLGHTYDLLGQIYIGVFAVVAGWLSWRTGGLEAAIALHIVNNAVLSVLGSVGLVDPNATDVGVPDLVFSLVITGGFALSVLILVRRRHIGRLSTPVAAAAVAA
jgi:membrane protease YdiL (CAAX protease family)